MRTITIPIDLDTALALLEPTETLIELVATGPGVGITIGAARLIEEAAKIEDPPPGTRGHTQASSEEGTGEEERRGERHAQVRAVPRRQLRQPPGARRAPPLPPLARRRCPSAPTHTDQAVGHRATTRTRDCRPARRRTHEAVIDV